MPALITDAELDESSLFYNKPNKLLIDSLGLSLFFSIDFYPDNSIGL